MQNISRDGYTEEQVKAVLHGDTPAFRFKFELLDRHNQYKFDIDGVDGCSVSNNSLADIKRKISFTLYKEQEIDWGNDRVMPWVWVKMPDGGYAKYPQGVFILTTPPLVAGSASISRNIEGYDLLLVLLDDRVTDRYVINAGTNIAGKVIEILASAGFSTANIQPSEKVLPTDREWELGTPKLRVINNLLSMINYGGLRMDEHGIPTAHTYTAPERRMAEYTYATNEISVILPGAELAIDYFDVPNRWIGIVSNPELEPLFSVYTNDNPDSPTSTVNRGRIIVHEPIEYEATDQEVLDRLVEGKASRDSQIYQKLKFDSGLMPFHSNSDVYDVYHNKLGIAEKCSETSWDMELRVGGRMKHEARKVVYV